MPGQQEIEAKFWKALKSDMTVMLGLVDSNEGHAQPMTAQLGEDEDSGPIWFFTARDVDLVKAMGEGSQAMLHFASKGHELFASVEGRHCSTIRDLQEPRTPAFSPGPSDDAWRPAKSATSLQDYLVDKLAFANVPATFVQGPNLGG